MYNISNDYPQRRQSGLKSGGRRSGLELWRVVDPVARNSQFCRKKSISQETFSIYQAKYSDDFFQNIVFSLPKFQFLPFIPLRSWMIFLFFIQTTTKYM